MKMELNHLSEISNLLPEHFGFFGLGTVELQSKVEASQTLPLDFDLLRGVGFRVYHLDDAPSALLLFIFGADLDESMYTEMGNVLASQLCKSLTEQQKQEMMISPPITLKSQQLRRLAGPEGKFQGPGRLYLHSYHSNGIEKSIPVETWTLPAGSHEVVNV
jgi:hypothetical protein